MGGFAAVGLAFWGVAYLTYFRLVPTRVENPPPWQTRLFRVAVVGVALAYGILALINSPEITQSVVTLARQLGGEDAPAPPTTSRPQLPPPTWKVKLLEHLP